MKWLAKCVCLLFVIGWIVLLSPSCVYAEGEDIPVLLYHKISDLDQELCISPWRFEQQVQALVNNGYKTITLPQLKQLIENGQAENMPDKPVLITFDDGYQDNYNNAYPILRKYGFTGTFFIITDYFDQPGYMTSSQVLEMKYFGMDIGSHTASHSILTRQTEADLVDQLNRSKKTLETVLEQPVEFIAYPCGYYNENVLAKVKAAGYQGGFTTVNGTNYIPIPNPYKLKRIPVFRHTQSVLSAIARSR